MADLNAPKTPLARTLIWVVVLFFLAVIVAVLAGGLHNGGAVR